MSFERCARYLKRVWDMEIRERANGYEVVQRCGNGLEMTVDDGLTLEGVNQLCRELRKG